MWMDCGTSVLFFFFPGIHEIQQTTVSCLYTNKQGNNKDLSSGGEKVGLCVCLCRWACVCVFWVQRSRGLDCVRTPACTASSSEAQRRHSQLHRCLLWEETHFQSSLLPRNQTDGDGGCSRCCGGELKLLVETEMSKKKQIKTNGRFISAKQNRGKRELVTNLHYDWTLWGRSWRENRYSVCACRLPQASARGCGSQIRCRMTVLSSVAWHRGQNKPAVMGMGPAWPQSERGCSSWVMGTQALRWIQRDAICPSHTGVNIQRAHTHKHVRL